MQFHFENPTAEQFTAEIAFAGNDLVVYMRDGKTTVAVAVLNNGRYLDAREVAETFVMVQVVPAYAKLTTYTVSTAFEVMDTFEIKTTYKDGYHLVHITWGELFSNIHVYVNPPTERVSFYADANVSMGNLQNFLVAQSYAIRMVQYWAARFGQI